MEQDIGSKKWCFQGNKKLNKAARVNVSVSVSDMVTLLCSLVFDRTTPVAEDAVVDALRTANFNHYSPLISGFLPARRAIAEYLSNELPDQLSPNDVYLTLGCQQAIEVMIHTLSSPGANILLPRPGFPAYETICAYTGLEVRHFDLLPERGWEVDLDAVEALADENTAAMVIISPGNPCGNVFTYQHLQKVAETARKLGIFVIADEVYEHITFGDKPFVPMGVFKSIVPVITLSSISKRWVVPGWRLGIGSLQMITMESWKKLGLIIESMKSYLGFSPDPATFIQGAIPQILENTKGEFFSKIINILREAADICYNKIEEIPCISCPNKPEGSMFVMVKLNLSMLEDVSDDMDFCHELAKEESVIIFPGYGLGLKNWLRISFAIEPTLLHEGLQRVKAFCERHSKKR
ncbi:hypothetical protein ACFE04_018431 [Oxalis oulophora]